MLFERFGEFDSVEELNMTAEGLKEAYRLLHRTLKS